MRNYHKHENGFIIGSLKLITWNPANISRYSKSGEKMSRNVMLYQAAGTQKGQAVVIKAEDLHKVIQGLVQEYHKICKSEIIERHRDKTKKITRLISDRAKDYQQFQASIENAVSQKKLGEMKDKIEVIEQEIRQLQQDLERENKKKEDALRVVDFNDGSSPVLQFSDKPLLVRVEEVAKPE